MVNRSPASQRETLRDLGYAFAILTHAKAGSRARRRDLLPAGFRMESNRAFRLNICCGTVSGPFGTARIAISNVHDRLFKSAFSTRDDVPAWVAALGLSSGVKDTGNICRGGSDTRTPSSSRWFSKSRGSR